MYTVTINGDPPKSKADVKKAVALGRRVSLWTDGLGGESGGTIDVDLTPGSYTFVGPSAYNRKFFGTVTISPEGRVRVS